MTLRGRWLILSILLIATILEGCSDCSDCDRGPIPVSYVRVHTATSAGSLAGVDVRLERNGFVPQIAATDALGEHTFEVLEAADREEVTLIVFPPLAYASPAPRAVSLVPSDTVAVEVVLEQTP